MASELSTINVQDFRKRVEEHVVNTFGSLIPEDQFRALVDAQIKAFFETPVNLEFATVNTGYGSSGTYALKSPITPFTAVVWAKVHQIVATQLSSYLTSKDSRVEAMIAELVRVPEVGDTHMTEAQRLMLAMAGTMFVNVMRAASRDAAANIALAFRNQNMPDLAMHVMNATGNAGNAFANSDVPEVGGGRG